MTAHVLAVGVGPGSVACLTGEAVEAIRSCDLVVGYERTLRTIRALTAEKEVCTVTMDDQDATYREIAAGPENRRVVVPFTGDVSFSESEVVDRLVEVFGKVKLVAGISSVQIAAARAGVPLDKARILTMHVSGPIEDQKAGMLAAAKAGTPVIAVPRPWPKDPAKNFMPSEIAAFLRGAGVDTGSLRARVYENLTAANESVFDGPAADMEGREFSDMSVLVLGESRPDPYTNYR